MLQLLGCFNVIVALCLCFVPFWLILRQNITLQSGACQVVHNAITEYAVAMASRTLFQL